MDPAHLTSELLTQHSGFLRALARGFLGDEQLAEDAVQDALVASLESSGQTSTNPLAWLVTVTRHAAIRIRRGAMRRTQREASVARSEVQSSSIEDLVRAEVLARISEAVVALPAPYRSVLLARYYQNLSTAMIAERERIPVPTVKSRLARAHALIRERLDRASGGDRTQWQPGVLALLGSSSLPPSATASASATISIATLIAMKAKIILGLVAVSVLALGFVLFRADLLGDRSPSPNMASSAPAVQAPTPAPQDDSTKGSASARAIVNVGEADPPTAPSMTMGEYLEAYYGDRWPEMQKKLAEWCALTGQTDCSDMKLDALPPPWESVAAKMEALITDPSRSATTIDSLIGWPAEAITEAEVKSRFKLTEGVSIGPAQLAAIESIGRKYDSEIRSCAESWNAGVLNAASSLWLAGRFEHGPLFVPMYTGTDAVHTIGLNKDQWCVSLVIKREEFPWLQEGLSSLTAVKKARDDEIQSYLDSLK